MLICKSELKYGNQEVALRKRMCALRDYVLFQLEKFKRVELASLLEKT